MSRIIAALMLACFFVDVAFAAPPAIEIPEAPPATNLIPQAAALFQQGKSDPSKYAEAASLFAQAYSARQELTADQLAAWTYCRIRLAADRWNASRGDQSLAPEIQAEIEDALKLAPGHGELQTWGSNILRSVTGKPAVTARPAETQSPTTGKANPSTDTWLSIESESFRVRFPGSAQEIAGAVLARAEDQRQVIFRRWSGPPSEAWAPRCEIVLHPSAASFANATGLSLQATGHALVKLEAAQVAERRIDLRIDDTSILEDTLPRELTYVILGDLFRTKAPPTWAALGMAVLAETPGEIDRHLATLRKSHQAGELYPLATLTSTPVPTKDRVTAFTVESVALVDYLVRRKGEKSFTIFLRDAERYGLEQALERQYRIAGTRQLDEEWQRAMLGNAGAQR